MRTELILVTGGAASGKSEYAEKCAVSIYEKVMRDVEKKASGMPHSENSTEYRQGDAPRLWYAATMHRDEADAETMARIARHRRQREGKGFTTTEQERQIGELKKIVHPGDVILLEDLSNLLANEMYPPEDDSKMMADRERWIRETIIRPILELHRQEVSIVAVGNRISEDLPGSWDEGTLSYLYGLQQIQRELGAAADQVVEAVCGIPVIYKSGWP